MKRIWKKAVGVGRKKKNDGKENNLSATDDSIRSRAIRLLSGDHNGVLSNGNDDDRRRGKYSPGRRRRKFNAANSYPNADVNDDKNSVASAAVSYRYAMHEYEQTVNPIHSNDDGLSDFVTSIHSNAATNRYQKSGLPPVPSRSFAESTSLADVENDDDNGNDYDFDIESAVGSHAGSAGGDQLFNIERQHFLYKDLIMYEERYGDSYIGESLTYMYPNGYQNMRPGSTPWKMSIGIFAFFVWLSVYIVGHCSDLAAAQDKAMDDDGADQIEIRWCGSQLLYTAWLASVIVTGKCVLLEISGILESLHSARICN